MITLRELFAGAPPDRVASIEAALLTDEKTHTPWFVQALIATGAWLASLFLLVFVCMLVDWHIFEGKQQASIGFIGAVLLIAAVAARRVVSGLFLAQCCLAFSLAAQGMIVFGFAPEGSEMGGVTLMVVSLALALYFLYPDFLHRTLTTLAALQMIYWWLRWTSFFDLGTPDAALPGSRVVLLDLLFLAQVAGLLWCFLPVGRHEARRPLGYALLASLVVVNAQILFVGWVRHQLQDGVPAVKVLHPWYVFVGPIFTAVLLFLVAVWAAGGRPMLDRYRPQGIAFGALLGLFIFLQMGPVLLTLLIMLLGFSLQNRLMLGLGVILFASFLFHYYYSLQLDLMEKAGVMILSGGLLLLLRGSLARLISPTEAA